ncbi:DUF5666 domain-containing protein [Candidatus Nitronereus thalassa]|uniref:DUF5666 domain-containing protein n=1 Tax=Candidatus Nitronereus thalassa TaxID=3020898 RepID=A0ABU3KC07_9BACT|nr:DUF5666 domain-containing protein [Candidatus Nitronereus thalassa]MDT7043923.1 DUF5666 domain-containing protein [Candidatus Nitronereus thalassa]
MKRLLALTILLLLLSAPLFVGAHGNASHVLGTVTETTQDQITVKTPKGKVVTIHISPDTIFQHNGITTNDARPQVGNRLIAEAAKIDDKLVAIEIKFSSPKSK